MRTRRPGIRRRWTRTPRVLDGRADTISTAEQATCAQMKPVNVSELHVELAVEYLGEQEDLVS